MSNIEIAETTKQTTKINQLSGGFINEVRRRLSNLKNFSIENLEWITLEHYQFSFNNPKFLLTAANMTRNLKDQRISEELLHNLAEEKDHSKMYKEALSEIGTNVDSHEEFIPTTNFFNIIKKTLESSSSGALGAMYAIELTSVFEHEVFRDISIELTQRRHYNWKETKLIYFHDLHLSGVEQSHRDELGKLIDSQINEDIHMENKNTHLKKVDQKLLYLASSTIIDEMAMWWEALLNRMESKDFVLRN